MVEKNKLLICLFFLVWMVEWMEEEIERRNSGYKFCFFVLFWIRHTHTHIHTHEQER